LEVELLKDKKLWIISGNLEKAHFCFSCAYFVILETLTVLTHNDFLQNISEEHTNNVI